MSVVAHALPRRISNNEDPATLCGPRCSPPGVLFVGVPRAEAQFASAIEGTVTDPSGGVVPGATVTLTNEETGAVQTVATNEAGYYRFPALGNGLYTVRVSLQGFKTGMQEHIRLQVAETRDRQPAMESARRPRK